MLSLMGQDQRRATRWLALLIWVAGLNGFLFGFNALVDTPLTPVHPAATARRRNTGAGDGYPHRFGLPTRNSKL